MTDKFDPYHTWLGIPTPEQPPNYYRLLGIDMFESDGETIKHAAERQSSYLRQLETPHTLEAQRLLDEVLLAKSCLLNPQAKETYDSVIRNLAKPQDHPRPKPNAPNSGRPKPQPAGATPQQPKAKPGKPTKPTLGKPNTAKLKPHAPSAGKPKPPHPQGDSSAPKPSVPVLDPAESSTLEEEFSAGEAIATNERAKKRPRRGMTVIRVTGHIVAGVLGLSIGWVILQWMYPQEETLDPIDEPVAVVTPEPEVPKGPREPVPPRKEPATTPEPGDAEPVNPDPDSEPTTEPPVVDPSQLVVANPEPDPPVESQTPSDPGTTLPADPGTTPPAETEPADVEQLKEQRATAIAEGDLRAALDLASRIANAEEADALQAKFDVLRTWQEKRSGSQEQAQLAQYALALLDEALAAERAELAGEIAVIGLVAARETENLSLIRRATLGVLKTRDQNP